MTNDLKELIRKHFTQNINPFKISFHQFLNWVPDREAEVQVFRALTSCSKLDHTHIPLCEARKICTLRYNLFHDVVIQTVNHKTTRRQIVTNWKEFLTNHKENGNYLIQTTWETTVFNVTFTFHLRERLVLTGQG